MRAFYFILLSIISIHSKSGNSGFFLTEDDFLNNRIHFASNYKIKENHGPIWDRIGYEADGQHLRLKQPDGNYITFKKGSVYGFIEDSVKYQFVKDDKEYLAVLFVSPSISIFLKKHESFYYRSYSSHYIVVYSHNSETSTQSFTNENIEKDFKDPVLRNELLKLSSQIEQSNLLHHITKIERFFKLQHLIESLLIPNH